MIVVGGLIGSSSQLCLGYKVWESPFLARRGKPLLLSSQSRRRSPLPAAYACQQSPHHMAPSPATSQNTEVELLKEVTANRGKEAMRFRHRASVVVAAPLEVVWQLWMDLKSAPCWMRWIDRVEFLNGKTINYPPGQLQVKSLSRWVCNTPGFEVAWVARIENIEVKPSQYVLQWATVEGLHNVGRVSFMCTDQNATMIDLEICHSLPQSLGFLMDSYKLSYLVKATLNTDLKRFQEYALNTLRKLNSVDTPNEI